MVLAGPGMNRTSKLNVRRTRWLWTFELQGQFSSQLRCVCGGDFSPATRWCQPDHTQFTMGSNYMDLRLQDPDEHTHTVTHTETYKTLRHTHTCKHTHTHTPPSFPWSLSLITLTQKEKAAEKKNQYFHRSIFKSWCATAKLALTPWSYLLKEPAGRPPLLVYRLTARWAPTSRLPQPPPSPPPQTHLTGEKTQSEAEGERPSWLQSSLVSLLTTSPSHLIC